MRTLLIVLMLFGCAGVLDAQPTTDAPDQRNLDDALQARIGLIARAGKDSVILRWVPTKPGVWLIGNTVGYRVERATQNRDGRPGPFKPLLDTAVKPWDAERWAAYSDAHPTREGSDSSDYVAIAYNLLNQSGDDGPARNDYSPDELKSIAERKAELDMRFGFAMYSVDRSADAADGLGLRFVDRGVTPGESYVYRVYLAGSAGDYRLDTGIVSLTARNPEKRALQEPVATGGEEEILLRWKANRSYSSYYIDRSEDNGATFKRMNRVALVTLRPSLPTDSDIELYNDSTAINYKVYIYRIYGTTAFADEEMIGEARGMARDVTSPTKPFLSNPVHIAERRVQVRWQAGAPESSDLAGYHVLRGGTDSGPYVRLTPKLLSAATRELVDSSFRMDSSNYYLVEAIDTAGNTVRSNSAYVALIDSTPPQVPTWISGKMDSNGVVTLRLHGNTERDLMGYRLLRANAPDHEFTAIIESFGGDGTRTATDTIYRDTVTVKTLTRWVYYRAVALDQNFNESGLSTVLAVPRPDVIPPVSPVITDVAVTDSSVVLRYARSSSEDMAYQTVYRKFEDGATWDSIARTTGNDSTFLDRNVKQRVVYQYAMLAVDSSGLRSETSMSVIARPYDPGVRPGVTHLTAQFDSTKHGVEVRWDYKGLDEHYWFVVYRSDADGGLHPYARISSTERSLQDSEPASHGSTMTYAVRVVAGSGAESKLEEKVQVVVGR